MLSTQTTLRKRSTLPSLEHAYTRTDLLITLGVLALLALVILPALANQRPRSARVICANNLRQIGVGFQLWGNDHADQLPYETAVSDGGTQLHALAANVWLHLSWISNEVATPSVFLCPSDSGQPAQDFTGNPAGGYLHSNFRHRATSYFLSHGGNDLPNMSDTIVAGDRNMTTDSYESCGRFGPALWIIGRASTVGGRWTSALHGYAGNVLGYDGRVQQLDSPGFLQILPRGNDTGHQHLITPR